MGALSKSAIFFKCIGNSCFTFATTCLTNVITEKVMMEINEGLAKKIVEFIEKNFLGGVNETSEKSVKHLYVSSLDDAEFEKKFSKMKENFDKAVGNDVVVNNSINSMCGKVSSTLSSNMQAYGNLLSKTSDSRVKAVGQVINGVLIVDKVWKVINSGIQTYNLISAVVHLVDTKFENKEEATGRNIKPELVKTRIGQINQILRAKIMSKVSARISAIVRAIVGIIVNKIANIAISATNALINSCMKGKNPLEQSKTAK